MVTARLGTLPGCSRQGFVKPASLLVGPEGRPTNTIRQIDACSGQPADFWWGASIRFGTVANGALEWAPGQSHPFVPLDFRLPDAIVEIGIRAGGCVQNAPVTLGAGCSWWTEEQWEGVRSPDVDGDCMVDGTDLVYVTTRLGSDDFCADLDGSGVVDALDVAIVEMTIGDQCVDDPSSVEEGSRPAQLELRVRPNPGSGPFRLELGLLDAGVVDIGVFDAGGRLVRSLGAEAREAGWSLLEWDGRDSDGKASPAGVYFVKARTGPSTVERSLLVVR